jgi:hypothetical protein
LHSADWEGINLAPGGLEQQADSAQTEAGGEISPKEFAQFISKEMVLAHGHRVEYAPGAMFGVEPLLLSMACTRIRKHGGLPGKLESRCG